MKLFLLLTISVALWADAKTEADLRVRLAASEASLQAALRDKALLAAQLSASIKAGAALAQAMPAVIGTQSSAVKSAAVTQAQAESTQTLTNTDASVRAQIEFEKQLGRMETDLKSIVVMIIILALLVISFTGVIVYSTRGNRRLLDDCDEEITGNSQKR